MTTDLDGFISKPDFGWEFYEKLNILLESGVIPEQVVDNLLQSKYSVAFGVKTIDMVGSYDVKKAVEKALTYGEDFEHFGFFDELIDYFNKMVNGKVNDSKIIAAGYYLKQYIAEWKTRLDNLDKKAMGKIASKGKGETRMTETQKKQVEKYLVEIETTLRAVAETGNESLYFDTWATINAIFGERIHAIMTLYAQVENQSSLAERNLRTAKEVLEYYIIDNYSSGQEMFEKKEPIIFLSHASANKTYGTALRDYMIGLGIKNEQLVYTSHHRNKVPMGKNFCDYLREQINREVFVVYLLSEDFFKSAMCLNEMGAAWVRQRDYDMVFVPNFDFTNYSYNNCAVDPKKIGAVLNGDKDCIANIKVLKKKIQKLFELKDNEDDSSDLMDELVKKITNASKPKSLDKIAQALVDSSKKNTQAVAVTLAGKTTIENDDGEDDSTLSKMIVETIDSLSNAATKVYAYLVDRSASGSFKKIYYEEEERIRVWMRKNSLRFKMDEDVYFSGLIELEEEHELIVGSTTTGNLIKGIKLTAKEKQRLMNKAAAIAY